MEIRGCLRGEDLAGMREEALLHAVEETDIFAGVDPNDKERVIRALRRAGHVVGYLGDGINDAPALHAADVGISVQGAADVAREAADFVLLSRDRSVLREGVRQGRRTFANTRKYVLTTMSATLGNMVSMAVASVLLPFLPLLASQVLLNNFLSDFPALALSGDRVDEAWVRRPERWNMAAILRFMLAFGLLSSLFDGLTFLALLLGFGLRPEAFRTGWFVESLLTELAVLFVVRTRLPLRKSRPGRGLVLISAAVALLALLLPVLPGAALRGFVPLPAAVVATLLAITLAYTLATEALKGWYWRGEVKASA